MTEVPEVPEVPEVTVPLYLTDPEGIGYAEYEDKDHTIFMFEPEYLQKVFGGIPPYITVTMSATKE
jgi:hypothetical protein